MRMAHWAYLPPIRMLVAPTVSAHANAQAEHAKKAGMDAFLRKEQEKIGAALDFHKAELETMTRKARDGAEILESTAKNSGEVFLDAVDRALGQAKDLATSLSERSEEAARAQERALDRMRDAARAAREAAET